MSYGVSKAREFVADLDEIFVYIGLENLEAALRFVDAVDATLNLISTHPFAGFQREFDNEGLGPLRFWPVKGFDRYLIAYQPNRGSKTLQAIRLLNSYRDFESIFTDR